MPSSMPADRPRQINPPTPIAHGRIAASSAVLPVPLTTLVGREREWTLASDLVRTPGIRLLTLSGPGGVGKTRLALRLAEELAGDFAGGVTFVPLAPVRHPRQLLLAIAGSLGIPDAGGTDLIELLATALRGRPRLLLLDNFEQIIEAGPSLTALLASCPDLKMIVTSRIVLRVTGEQELVVPPLESPGASRSHTLDDIARSDAVALFLLRARLVNPSFELTEENAPSIIEICRRLDGLPLAIELAAARTKVLPPQALAARLSDRLQVLIGGPRDQPARLQTMRNAIAWSYDLLESDEQELFRRLSVFPAGFGLDAAEHVAGSDLVLDRITSLVDKSLLQQSTDSQADPRFTMLETIRAFGLEQLAASGEEDESRRRHADWCRDIVAEAAMELYEPPAQAALDRLEQEHDSLRAALGWLLAAGEITQAAEMCVDAWWFWFTHNHLTIGRYWCTSVFERFDFVPSSLSVRLHAATGWFVEATGDFETAIAMHTTGLALARQLDDPFVLGVALFALADVADEHRPDGRQLALFEEAADLFRALNAGPWLGTVLNAMAAIHRDRGAYARATALIEESLSLARACDFAWLIALALGHLGRISRMQGDLESALKLDREAIVIWYDMGDWWRLSRAINEYGITVEQTGQFEYATQLLAASEVLREQLDAAFMPVLALARDRALASLHRHLSDAKFAAAWEAGRSMMVDELIAVVVNPPESVAPRPPRDPVSTAGLSPREMDALRLLVAGYTDRQIAEELFISHRTAQGHVGSIFNKLGVNSRTAAATTAIRLGLIQIRESDTGLMRDRRGFEGDDERPPQ